MKDQLSKEQNEAVIKALNEAIDSGPWDNSSFLKVIGKNLTKIRDEFISQIGARSSSQLRADTKQAERMALRNQQQEIYISLYSAEGSKLEAWEKIIANLPRQTICRPIYSSEEDLQAIFRVKDNKINEAYVAVFVNKTDILSLSADKSSQDKLGKILLNLKDKTLNLENISRFVHLNTSYRYEKGRLIKI